MASEAERQNAMDVFGDITDAFHVLLGAKEGKLNTPCTVEVSSGGDDEAECLGSVRHMAEFIEDAGYVVDIAELGETQALPSQEVRFAYRITVTERE